MPDNPSLTVTMRRTEFMRGIALVIASLVRDYDQPTIAASILATNGIALSEFGSYIDDFDMRYIRNLCRNESQLEHLRYD